MANVAIFGAGALGREVLLALRDLRSAGQDVTCVAFVVDPAIEAPESVHGIRVYRGLSRFTGQTDIDFVVALGDPARRRRAAAAIEQVMGARFATVVHPKAWVGSPVVIGRGSMVMGQASITTDIRIGDHVLIHAQASIPHDCDIEDFSTIAPAVTLGGAVRLREGCDLGMAACVLPRLEVGRWSKVGAGAVVTRPVAPNTTVVGVPARQTAERPQRWQDAIEPLH